MKRTTPLLPLLAFMGMTFMACSSHKKAESSLTDGTEKASLVQVPTFDADSAWNYVKSQVDFGPRVPNTAAHQACGDYLAQKLEQFGAKVYNQHADLTAYNGTVLKSRNIIGAYKPESKKRVALFAHWDCRPWADHDPNPKNHQTPVQGANDGASGVGVLLEIARQLQQQEPNIGIDLIFFDSEDYGAHTAYKGPHQEEFWCLGSQYWSRNPHVNGYNARFGILLDMVGGKNALFRYEYYSEEFAKNINRKVWKAAHQAGFGTYFEKANGGGCTDDHLFVNRIARIPTIDIIPYSETASFFEHWHTVKDDMDAIDRNTLKAVGQTVLQVIYHEK